MWPNSNRLGVAELKTLPDPSRAARTRALQVLSLMRSRGLSLQEALRRVGTTYETVFRYVGSAIEKGGDGRWRPTGEWDRLLRAMEVITREGAVTLYIRDSRSARKAARHREAVVDFLLKGDTRDLRRFEGESFEADGERYYLATDPELLRELASGSERNG